MKRVFLLLFACMVACVATAQDIITYTNTKLVFSNGEEQEGYYSQIQVILVGNQLKRPEYPNLIYLYHHQENGWSVYYPAYWNNWSRQWIFQHNEWYAVSPDQKTINHSYLNVTIGGNTYVQVYKQGVQHKSIGPMYE